jgi:hypothetical protein
MDRLFVSPQFAERWTNLGVSSVAAAVAKFLPNYQQRRKVTVQPATLNAGGETIDAFFKLYHHREGGWRFWLRKSKAKTEFDNYLVFQRLGVAAAEPIACGEERDAMRRLHRDFIITRAVPKALGLDEWFRRQPPREQRQKLLLQLAGMLRRLHSANFFYYDLVWRNILVSETRGKEPKLFLIDCPRGGVARVGRAHKVLRDLASLDKTASQLCSRTERLRFLRSYLATSQCDKAVRSLAAACLQYRRIRWPEDWHGK